MREVYRRFYERGAKLSTRTAQSIERLGYVLDDRGIGVLFSAGESDFSVLYNVQNGSGTHQASYWIDTRGFFPGTPAGA
jgi:hypothetical protein